MPLITFSKADGLRQKNLDTGWYSFQVKNILGPTPNEAKDGVKYEAQLALIDSSNPDFNGKEISTWFGFSKNKGYGLDFVASALNTTIADIIEKPLDTDLILAAKLDAKVKVDVYEGRQNNKFEGFLPYKKAAGQPVPF